MMIHEITFTFIINEGNFWKWWKTAKKKLKKNTNLFVTYKIEISLNDYFPWDINYMKKKNVMDSKRSGEWKMKVTFYDLMHKTFRISGMFDVKYCKLVLLLQVCALESNETTDIDFVTNILFFSNSYIRILFGIVFSCWVLISSINNMATI